VKKIEDIGRRGLQGFKSLFIMQNLPYLGNSKIVLGESFGGFV